MAETLGKFADEMWHQRTEETDAQRFRLLERTLLNLTGTVEHLDSPLPEDVGQKIRVEFADLLAEAGDVETSVLLHGPRNENGKWIVQ